jgi:hypothetical protein
LDLNGGESVSVPLAYLGRVKGGEPIGGYFVQYEDGYQSWSPAAAFEAGYLPERMVLTVAGPSPEDLEAIRRYWTSMRRGGDCSLMIAPMSPELPTKVTRDALEAKIKRTTFERRGDCRTTLCELTMENGTTVQGFSVCAVSSEYRQDLGEKDAYEDALNQAWAFEGYLLRDMRFRAGLPL